MVNEEVEENLGSARDKMKRAYDTGKGKSTAGPGDLVLVKNHSRRSGRDQCFKGPFTVLKRNGPNVLIRQEKAEGITVESWLHLNRCKLYALDPLTSLMTVPSIGINPGAERGLPEVTSDEDTFYGFPDELGGECTTNEPVSPRKSNRIRKPSKKLVEAQWMDDLTEDDD